VPTAATKNSRDIIAYALLAVAALYFIGALSLLLKSSGGQFSGIGFAEKSAIFGAGFTAAVPLLSLVAAVVLVTRLGEPSANARMVVLAALGIAGLDLLFGVITFFAQLGASSLVGEFSGVQGAGKIVGFVVGLAHLLFVAAALFYILTELQRLPAPARARAASQWGADRGYAQYGGQGAQQPWGQPDQGYRPGGQQPWGPAGPTGQQAWGQADQGGAQAWGQADQGGAQPWGSADQGGGQAWGQQGSSYGWTSPDQAQGSWGQPAGQTGAQGGNQAPAWPQQAAPSASSWEQSVQGGWSPHQGYPGEQARQPAAGWESQPDQPTATEEPTTVTEEPAAATEPDETPDDTPPAGEGWWQHPQH
jgi:hypothetical protein